jgi:hypothetical protein
MNYHIQIKGFNGKWQRIASFVYGLDRNYVLDLLTEKHGDTAFQAEYKEEE